MRRYALLFSNLKTFPLLIRNKYATNIELVVACYLRMHMQFFIACYTNKACHIASKATFDFYVDLH